MISNYYCIMHEFSGKSLKHFLVEGFYKSDTKLTNIILHAFVFRESLASIPDHLIYRLELSKVVILIFLLAIIRVI